MVQIQTVGIVGHGAIGSALGKLWESVQIKVQYFDQDPAKSAVSDVAELTKSSQLVLICAPAQANRAIAQSIHAAQASTGAGAQLVVSVAKGVEDGFITVDQILASELEGKAWGILYGPMIADELSAGKQSAAILATASANWHDLTIPGIKLTASTDAKSVALCGVLKNIYAVAFGINDGLNLGMNFKGALAAQIIKEMQAITAKLGGQAAMAESLAGLGDLLATGWSEQSFNHRIGKALAEGLAQADASGEGIHAVKEIGKVLEVADYRVLATLSDIIHDGADPTILGSCLG